MDCSKPRNPLDYHPDWIRPIIDEAEYRALAGYYDYINQKLIEAVAIPTDLLLDEKELLSRYTQAQRGDESQRHLLKSARAKELWSKEVRRLSARQ